MNTSKIPVLGWLNSESIGFGIPLLIIGLVAFFFSINFLDISQGEVITFLFATSPIWLPYITFKIFFPVYMDMVGTKFKIKNGRTTLEIKLPQEVFKSPAAMELVLSQLYNPQSPDNLMQTYLDGKRPLVHSFELVSTGGNVKFYVNFPAKKSSQNFITNMYAQYPGIEITELDIDYTAEIPHDLSGMSMMSFHFGKKEDQEFPIKTYIDFGLDKMPKEEEKIDPMTPLLEVLSTVAPHERVWVQFLCIPHRKQSFKLGQLKSSPTWEKDIQKKIDEIMKRDSGTKTGLPELEGMPRLTSGERNIIEAMERNAEKYAFEFAGRWIYMAKKENNHNPNLYTSMIRSLTSWDAKGRNGLGITWRTDFNYKMISDPFNKIVPGWKKQELKEYKLRKLDPKSLGMSFKVMSVEELATIYHIPGSVAMTPALNRVPSTRGEAPNNLPIANLPS